MRGYGSSGVVEVQLWQGTDRTAGHTVLTLSEGLGVAGHMVLTLSVGLGVAGQWS